MRKYLPVMLLSVFFVCALPVLHTTAASNASFSGQILVPTEADVYTEFLTVATNGGCIQNFAISDEGQIAVCTKGNYVNVYRRDGSFSYGVRYVTSGDSRVFWNEEQLVIYLVRGELCLLPDEAVQSISVWEFTGSGSDLLTQTVFTNCAVNGTFYQMLPSDFPLSRSKGYQLVMQTGGGAKQVIYTDTMDKRNAFIRLLIITFVCLFVVFGIWKNLRIWKDLAHL
ncbi:MAG: hypothetical protein IJT77_03035 [Clostridia bacterium]|nr:hypothetical protein [Clostridia bacterium]